MAKVREMTDAEWHAKFRKVMGKDPAGGELAQFRKNYLKPFSYSDEKQFAEEGKTADDYPFLPRPRKRTRFAPREAFHRDPDAAADTAV